MQAHIAPTKQRVPYYNPRLPLTLAPTSLGTKEKTASQSKHQRQAQHSPCTSLVDLTP